MLKERLHPLPHLGSCVRAPFHRAVVDECSSSSGGAISILTFRLGKYPLSYLLQLLDRKGRFRSVTMAELVPVGTSGLIRGQEPSHWYRWIGVSRSPLLPTSLYLPLVDTCLNLAICARDRRRSSGCKHASQRGLHLRWSLERI